MRQPLRGDRRGVSNKIDHEANSNDSIMGGLIVLCGALSIVYALGDGISLKSGRRKSAHAGNRKPRVREGAQAFLKRQLHAIGMVGIVIFALLATARHAGCCRIPSARVLSGAAGFLAALSDRIRAPKARSSERTRQFQGLRPFARLAWKFIRSTGDCSGGGARHRSVGGHIRRTAPSMAVVARQRSPAVQCFQVRSGKPSTR